MSKYEVLETLYKGSGLSNSIKKLRDKSTGDNYALKVFNSIFIKVFIFNTQVINKSQLNSEGIPYSQLQESLNQYKQLNHPSICNYKDHFEDENTLCIIAEICNGDLIRNLSSKEDIPFTETVNNIYIVQSVM